MNWKNEFCSPSKSAHTKTDDYTVYALNNLENFFYRFFCLKTGKFKQSPTCLRLLNEIRREFQIKGYMPNYLNIVLFNNYSHRTLKRVFKSLGYNISYRPTYLESAAPVMYFNAWRIF